MGIVFLLLVTLYVGYSAFALYGKYAEARDKKKEAEAALIEAQTREAQVKADLDKLSTDRGREEVIREKFNVVKEGEGVVVIPGDDETSTTDTNSQKKENFFQKWFGN